MRGGRREETKLCIQIFRHLADLMIPKTESVDVNPSLSRLVAFGVALGYAAERSLYLAARLWREEVATDRLVPTFKHCAFHSKKL